MTPERADELMSESYLRELKEEGAGASIHIAGRKAILAACAEERHAALTESAQLLADNPTHGVRGEDYAELVLSLREAGL